LVKNTSYFFQNINLRQLPPFSPIQGIYSAPPLVMVFALRPVSGHAKTTPPLRGRGIVHSPCGAFTGSISRIQKIGLALLVPQQGGGRVFARHW
jgi:hypothetical protein